MLLASAAGILDKVTVPLRALITQLFGALQQRFNGGKPVVAAPGGAPLNQHPKAE
jgi:hypothetical protein